ncbi:MAG TPA: hypothetical protein VMK83_09550 [Gaiellaceae bacterium]|nr:hypothetical protein [Gaiellaceae bacterium]
MPIVTQCIAPGCATLTVGPLCIEHEQQPERMFVAGRPFVRAALETRRALALSNAYAPSLRRASERPAAVRPLR